MDLKNENIKLAVGTLSTSFNWLTQYRSVLLPYPCGDSEWTCISDSVRATNIGLRSHPLKVALFSFRTTQYSPPEPPESAEPYRERAVVAGTCLPQASRRQMESTGSEIRLQLTDKSEAFCYCRPLIRRCWFPEHREANGRTAWAFDRCL